MPNKKLDENIVIDGLSAGKLRWGLWFVSHKVKLYKILLGGLIAASFLLWGYSVWGWIDYLLGTSAHENLLAELVKPVDYTSFHQQLGAKPLRVNSAQVFNSGVGKYDIVAEVSNPNDDFIASFSYYFIVDGNKTEVKATFLLPGESRPAAIMGIKSNSYLGNPTFGIESLSWQRITARVVDDPKTWQSRHFYFTVSDFVFIKASVSGADADIIRFALTNNSPYDYYTPNFYVGLYQSGSLAGVAPLYFDSFNSAESKKVDLRSFAPNLQITEIMIYPVINIYSKEAYVSNSL